MHGEVVDTADLQQETKAAGVSGVPAIGGERKLKRKEELSADPVTHDTSFFNHWGRHEKHAPKEIGERERQQRLNLPIGRERDVKGGKANYITLRTD